MRERVRGAVRLGGHVIVVRHHVHAGHFVLLFPLHPPVLEPYLYLPLGQAQRVRDLDPPPPGQVPVEMELLLQLQRLVPRVRRPLPFRLAVGVHRACERQSRVNYYTVCHVLRCRIRRVRSTVESFQKKFELIEPSRNRHGRRRVIFGNVNTTLRRYCFVENIRGLKIDASAEDNAPRSPFTSSVQIERKFIDPLVLDQRVQSTRVSYCH